jgi:hypothetical protein
MQVLALSARPIAPTRNPTTSFLTATTLIYAIGAGITAAAGTRLALQLILDKGFKLFSFQLPDLERPGIVIYCHYLPVSGLGNLRACCLPWMWWPSLMPPLRNLTLIIRYPLKPW